jgi:hypothetical protein
MVDDTALERSNRVVIFCPNGVNCTAETAELRSNRLIFIVRGMLRSFARSRSTSPSFERETLATGSKAAADRSNPPIVRLGASQLPD